MPTTRFKVVKEVYGWAVRSDEGMMSSYWSRSLALNHANNCADMLRRHGEQAQVIVEDSSGGSPRPSGRGGWGTPPQPG